MSTLQKNTVTDNRKKQMYRLMSRYTQRIETTYWVMQYCWHIGYQDLTPPVTADREIKFTEFWCNTNNLIFAAMIFEAQMLPTMVDIFHIEVNTK